jgi:putative tricarboxylic transport membrane protein
LLILVITAFVPGERVSNFNLRGPLFIGAALAAFAVSIRPLGFVVAGPLTILIASIADSQTRWREAALLAALLTGVSIIIFGYLLDLSIPMLPSPQAIASLGSAFR